MKKLLLSLYLSTLFCLLAQGQEWREGTLKLNSNEIIEGSFHLQHFGHLTAIRHLREDNTQGTFNIGQVNWLVLTDQDDQIFKYKTFDFLPEKSIVQPQLLLQVLYSSDSVRLLSGNIRSIKSYFNAYPIPGVAVLFTWGNKLVDEQTVLISLGDLQDLTVIGRKSNTEDQSDLVEVNSNLVLKKLMTDYKKEVKEFVRSNDLKWNSREDLYLIVEYYDQLRYGTM